MKQIIHDIMHFPIQFPDLNDTQVIAAEEVVLSVGLGFGNQQQAIDGFIESLSPEQKVLITNIQKVLNFFFYKPFFLKI